MDSDLQEVLDFEMKLAALKLTKWNKKPRGIKQTKAKTSRINENRILLIGTNYDNLHLEVRKLIVDLHTSWAPRNKFKWQIQAKALGIPIEHEAEDMCECTICNSLTPLTMLRRCVPCYNLEKAIQKDPVSARKILELLK